MNYQYQMCMCVVDAHSDKRGVCYMNLKVILKSIK